MQCTPGVTCNRSVAGLLRHSLLRVQFVRASRTSCITVPKYSCSQSCLFLSQTSQTLAQMQQRSSAFLSNAPPDFADCEVQAATGARVSLNGDQRAQSVPSSFQRPAPLKVTSLQERNSQYVEHWAHSDEDGIHIPLWSPDIQKVRSVQDSVRVPSTPSAAAEAVRASLDSNAFKRAPVSPDIDRIRLLEGTFKRPSDAADVQCIRDVMENRFKGVNDPASAAQAAARRTLSAASTPHTNIPRSPTAAAASTSAQAATASSFPLADPSAGAQGLTETSDGSELMAKAMKAAAVQLQQEDWVRRPKSDAVRDAIRRREESFKRPSDLPEVHAVREGMAMFRQPAPRKPVADTGASVSKPEASHVTPAVRTLSHQTTSQHTVTDKKQLAASLADPFGAGGVYSGERRAVVRNISLTADRFERGLAHNISLPIPARSAVPHSQVLNRSVTVGHRA